MSSSRFIALLLTALAAPSSRGGEMPPPKAAETAPAGMVAIPPGFFRPVFRPAAGSNALAVAGFYLDIRPVTQGDFLEFVRANPEWRRSAVKRSLADEGYLSHWAGDLDLGPDAEKTRLQPVTEVSWFAAGAYAAWKEKRLPTLAEWEYAAAASPTRPNGANDAAFTRQILKWYSTPNAGALPDAGSGATNYWGLRDMHGLVWEWVSDFNETTNSRGGGPVTNRDAVCGGGARDATDAANYPAFMRYAFRSSLQPNYTVRNLGFRCARDLTK